MILALFLGCMISYAPDSQLDTLCAANDSAVSSIYTCDVEYDLHWNGKHGGLGHWQKQGKEERFRFTTAVNDIKSNKPINIFTDGYEDGATFRGFLGSRPPNPGEALTPQDQKGFRGGFYPYSPQNNTQRAHGDLCILAMHTSISPRISLKALAAECRSAYGDDGAKVVGKKELGGREMWLLRFRHPGVTEESLGKTLYPDTVLDIYLDPACNFMIKKLDARYPPVDGVVVIAVDEVLKFRDCGGNIFFPVEVTRKTGVEGKPFSSVAVTKVTRLSTNAKSDKPLLGFQFPEGLLAQVYPIRAGKVDVHLMGKNNSVVRTFKRENENELMNFVGESFMAAQNQSRWHWGRWLTGGFGVLVLVLACAVGYIRWRRTN